MVRIHAGQMWSSLLGRKAEESGYALLPIPGKEEIDF